MTPAESLDVILIIFITGFSVAEVLQIQAKAQEMLVEGKTIMAWGDSWPSQTLKLGRFPE